MNTKQRLGQNRLALRVRMAMPPGIPSDGGPTFVSDDAMREKQIAERGGIEEEMADCYGGRPANPASSEGADVRELWSDLLEKDDRTSPEEYPDMALITFEEFKAVYTARDAEIVTLRRANETLQADIETMEMECGALNNTIATLQCEKEEQLDALGARLTAEIATLRAALEAAEGSFSVLSNNFKYDWSGERTLSEIIRKVERTARDALAAIKQAEGK